MTTSAESARALLHNLNFLGGERNPDGGAADFAFALDFDSGLVWPDLPFDTSSPSARYDDGARVPIVQLLAASGGVLRAKAPLAFAFVNAHLDSALLRHSPAIASASSSSNRECVGRCLLTNMHMADDATPICIEALVHESIHQFMYRMERDHGQFCDLQAVGRFRSPWSGNRIPLHSLVHASLVWFGVLTLWCQIARSPSGAHDATLVRERVGRSMSGFTFLPDVLAHRAFPRGSVDPRILALMEHLAHVATVIADANEGRGTAGDVVARCADDGWIPDLVAGVALIENRWS